MAQDGNGWYQVQVGGPETGWLFAGGLSLNGDCSSLPLVPYPATTPTQTSTQCLVRAADFNAVNMYAGPGSDYAILNAFGPNDTPVGIARSDNGWYRVSLYIFSNTWIGWTPAYRVTTIGDCETLPLVASAGYSPEMMPMLLTPTPFMPDMSSQPTPTTPYQSMIGTGDYPLVTVTDVGTIPPNTRVNISYAYYDGTDWIYFVIAENGASGEARGWQLALAS